MKKHGNITVKSWSDTRWERRLHGVHAFRYQASEIWEALLLQPSSMLLDKAVTVISNAKASHTKYWELYSPMTRQKPKRLVQ